MPLTPNGISAVAPPRCGWSGRRSDGGVGEWERNRPDVPSGTRERISVSLAPSPRRPLVYFQGRGEFSMRVQHSQQTSGLRRRDLLKTGLVAGVTLSAL